MTEFEENIIIKDVFLKAAAVEFENELYSTDPVPISLQHRNEMATMQADPNKWAKRRIQPVWKRVASMAATIILACSLSLGALMAASPTVRAAVINWVTEWYETHVVYRFSGEVTTEDFPRYRITSLPDGYNGDGKVLELPGDTEVIYENGEGQTVRFEYARMETGAAVMVSTENMQIEDININGCRGQIYISAAQEQSSAIVWHDERTNIQFVIDAYMDKNELLHMAESVSLDKTAK